MRISPASAKMWGNILVWVVPPATIPLFHYVLDRDKPKKLLQAWVTRDLATAGCSSGAFLGVQHLVASAIKNAKMEPHVKDLIATGAGITAFLPLVAYLPIWAQNWQLKKFTSALPVEPMRVRTSYHEPIWSVYA